MAKETICGFDGWVLFDDKGELIRKEGVEANIWVFKFNKQGQLSKEKGFDKVEDVSEHFRKRIESFPEGTQPTQHLFVFVHGVDTNFAAFRDYIKWFSLLYEQYVRDEPPIRREDIGILGIKWESQKMEEMLGLLLSFKKEKMPAEDLAKEGLKDAIHAIHETAKKKHGKVRVHLTGHSMGAQVLLYLLPQLAPDVEIGSMMFLQGFAPSSAFREPKVEEERKNAFQRDIKEIVYKRFLTWLPHVDLDLPTEPRLYPIVSRERARELLNVTLRPLGHPLPWGIHLDLEVKKVIDPGEDFLTENIIKVTYFANHLGKVKGPILATTTKTLWADYQVGIAEISFYSPPGVLGVRGFQGANVQDCDVHDVDEDEIEGGDKAYGFTIPDKCFFNLRADPYYITDHDDFKNRAVAYAHLRAAGVIDEKIVKRAKSSRRTDPLWSPVRSPETWMQETWARIGERTLTQLCMPGSHDSGMGVITHVLPPREELIERLVREYVTEKAHALLFKKDDKEKKENVPEYFRLLTETLTSGTIDHLTRTAMETARAMMPRLCQTQTSPIREQLRQGCRFFDLRPAWWVSGEFYLAHGDFQTFPREGREPAKLGYIGGIGESLEAALKDIASFASEKRHSRELIVLKFSHAADWTHAEGGSHPEAFTVEQKKQLHKTIRDRLRDVMISGRMPLHIDDIRLNELVKRGKVLCIYEQALCEGLNSDNLKSAYRYGSTDDFSYRLYDDYANSRNFAYVIGDQWWKFKDKMKVRREDKASDQVFVLSWTATLKPGPGVMDMRSVLDNAQALNKKLQPSMKNWIRRGDISGAARPNILYVDAYDATVLDTVAMINAVDLKSKPVGL